MEQTAPLLSEEAELLKEDLLERTVLQPKLYESFWNNAKNGLISPEIKK